MFGCCGADIEIIVCVCDIYGYKWRENGDRINSIDIVAVIFYSPCFISTPIKCISNREIILLNDIWWKTEKSSYTHEHAVFNLESKAQFTERVFISTDFHVCVCVCFMLY